MSKEGYFSSALFDRERQRFTECFQEKGNRVQFFSARFGMGKSTFLQEYFREKTKEYEVFTIYPVNYVISSNENVVKYLRYDIALEMIGRGYYSLAEYTALEKIGGMVQFKSKEITYACFKEIIKGAAHLGKNLLPPLKKEIADATIKAVEGISKELSNQYREFENNVDETKVFGKFREEVQFGELYGNDFAYRLIEVAIRRVKESKVDEKDKEAVLIVEDLDRLDPEHTFRLLNVFAAHLIEEEREEHQSLPFDKVVFVGDYNNLISIYHHRFGSKTDSTGYFNKFFSRSVFDFLPTESIWSFVSELIDSMGLDLVDDRDKYKVYPLFWDSSISKNRVKELLSYFCRNNCISLRSLAIQYKKSFRISYFANDDSMLLPMPRFPIVYMLRFLKQLFGSYSSLIDVLKSAEERSKNISMLGPFKWLVEMSVPAIVALEQKTTLQTEQPYYLDDSYAKERLSFFLKNIEHTSKLVATPAQEKIKQKLNKPFYYLIRLTRALADNNEI